MNFLERAIKRGIDKAVSGAVSNAVEQGVKKAVQPMVNQAANGVAKATTQSLAGVSEAAAELNSAMEQSGADAANVDTAELKKAFSMLENMATDMVKDKKVCSKCGEMAGKDEEFCPNCGEKLPSLTMAQLSLCPNCGKQNELGKNFCTACGTKLPLKIEAEKAAAEADAKAMALWDEWLPQYPKWAQGGKNFSLEIINEQDGFPTYEFRAEGVDEKALDAYAALLKQNGFKQQSSGSDSVLCKNIGSVDYCFAQIDVLTDNGVSPVFYAEKH